MWIPKDTEELEQGIRSGSLEETTIFDAKRELTRDSREIAKDIASMANDGSVLLYGVDQDANGRPSVLSPIPYLGEPERISNVVRTSISPPPEIIVKCYPSSANTNVGYILVAVPASQQAPHMVVVKDISRFYGRTATGNTPLNQGEVERLYQRRQQWAVDFAALLDEEKTYSTIPEGGEYGHLHVLVRPVASSENLFDTALKGAEPVPFLNDLLRVATTLKGIQNTFAPNFNYPHNGLDRGDGWLAFVHSDPPCRA